MTWLGIPVWKLVTIIGMCCLLIQLPLTSYTNHQLSSEGPIFSDYGDFYGDFLNETASVWFHVTVTDPDGVDLVIGSTKESSGVLWHNVTLVVSESDQYRYYGYYSVILPTPGSTTFEVKYYAVDSLGNWNVSDTVFHYLNIIGITSPDLIPVFWGTAISVTIVVLIILVFKIKLEK
jgi:hypothetical protein